MHLLYLTFGESISNHLQAQFSICSFLAQRQTISSINIITDQPVFYKNLNEYIKIIKINEETLKEWRGEYDFFWRIKIKAIEMVCNMYVNEPVLYLDSDTFLYTNITPLKEELHEGTASMHENEGRLSQGKSKTEKRMWQKVGHKDYSEIKINETHSMWNAGVVATPNKKDGKELRDALKICDEMCMQGVRRRLIEQFALSVSLQENYGLTAADRYIGHYWANKEGWNEACTDLFLGAYFKSISIEEVIQQVADFDFSKLPIKMTVKNTKIRLEKMLEKVFPPKEISFLKKDIPS